ncbi:MAG: hypothetical protein DYG96_16100 [Chlorobi bacterium CHB2]|nr:hypothetical protein [Chlorobi bacterium CHB2]
MVPTKFVPAVVPPLPVFNHAAEPTTAVAVRFNRSPFPSAVMIPSLAPGAQMLPSAAPLAEPNRTFAAPAVPATSSSRPAVGAAVPIPTSPVVATRRRSMLLVRTTSGWPSVVPKKLIAGLVPPLPVRLQNSPPPLLAVSTGSQIGAKVVPMLNSIVFESVLKIINPVAGLTIAFRSAVVSRGIRKPAVVVDRSRIADLSGAMVPIPMWP